VKPVGKAIDYSGGVPSGASVHAAGYGGVIRYLQKRGISRVKVLTAAEYQDMTRNGVGVTLLYEDTDPGRCGQGRSAGITDGAWALQQARNVGIAQPRSIIFCVDYDATPDAVIPYFQGTASQVGRAVNGAYGSAQVIEALFAAGLITWGMQTRAWSHGNVAAGIQLYQDIGYVTVGGVQCDVDYILTADFGQHPAPTWLAKPPTPTPSPIAQPTEQDEEMTWIAKPTTPGTYLLVMPHAVIVVADGKSVSNLEKDLGIKATILSDGDFARLAQLVGR
jgi:hypothetical protein